MQFKRDIGLWGLMLLGAGGIIGSGWLFGPLYTAQIAGPAGVISWILGGFLMILIMLTFAELITAFPVAGSMVQVAELSHGKLLSFISGWMIWISSVVIAPIETMAIIQYAGNYIPGLVTKVSNTTVLTAMGILVSAVVMLFMCFLNFYGARFFSRLSGIITTIKLIMPIATAALLLCINFHARNFYQASTGGFAPYGWHGILAALPLGGVVFSLIGAHNIFHLAAESRHPKNIPLALVGALLLCVVLYVFIQFAFAGSIQAEYLTGGWSKLNYPGDSGPFAGILIALGLTWFVGVLYADAIISPFGTGYIFTGATARVNYGLSKIGMFPEFLSKLTSRGVPVRAILVNYLIGLALFLPFPGWQHLVGFVVSSIIISYSMGPIALVVLRKTQPELARPFRVPAPNVVALLAFYSCNLLIFWTGWETIYRMIIAVAIGFLFSLKYMKQWRNVWWMLVYLPGILVISYLGTFGNGAGYIPFGVDFAVVAVFSLLIFALATKKW